MFDEVILNVQNDDFTETAQTNVTRMQTPDNFFTTISHDNVYNSMKF